MGHVTDKVELIVLGGTWSDYPADYQAWFVRELFRALNDGDGEAARREAEARRALYRNHGIPNRAEDAAARVAAAQREVCAGKLTYNHAVRLLYQEDAAWQAVAAWQRATLDEVAAQHQANEQARHRCVGLVVETRPDAVTPESLTLVRRLGCTKIQMGIQSLDAGVLARNGRASGMDDVRRAFALMRLFGFKTHVHAMVNLCGSTPEGDKRDYRRLVTEAAYQPDEVKLYPCVLWRARDWARKPSAAHGNLRRGNAGGRADDRRAGHASPHARLAHDTRHLGPRHRGRNKKTNLRQLVEARAEATGQPIEEMRHREIGARDASDAGLALSPCATAPPCPRNASCSGQRPRTASRGSCACHCRTPPAWRHLAKPRPCARARP